MAAYLQHFRGLCGCMELARNSSRNTAREKIPPRCWLTIILFVVGWVVADKV